MELGGPPAAGPGQHVGKSVPEIISPHSLLPLVFVAGKGADSCRQGRKPPGIETWPWANTGETVPARPVRDVRGETF